MKQLIVCLLIVIVQHAAAQYPYTDSLRRANNRMFIRDLLWSDEGEGIYLGPTASYEMQTFGLGGEVKAYSCYYTYLLSGSLYANVRHLYTNDPALPKTAVGFGAHFLFFALEGNAYLGGDRTRWYITPKVGFDRGAVSVFYGYGFRLGEKDLSSAYGHSLTVKYAINPSEYRNHQSRKRSWMKFGLHPKFTSQGCD